MCRNWYSKDLPLLLLLPILLPLRPFLLLRILWMWAHLLATILVVFPDLGNFLGLPCSNLSDAPGSWFLEATLAHFGEVLYIKMTSNIMKNLAQKDSPNTYMCLNQF